MSLSGDPHRKGRPKTLRSDAGRELKRLRRRLVVDLYLQRGPFWEAISEVRGRWKIEPRKELPPLDPKWRSPPSELMMYPILGAREWTNDQWVQWHRDMESIKRRALPEGHSPGRRFDEFVWGCVIYDPPDEALPEYADRFPIGATVLFSEGLGADLPKDQLRSMPGMVDPPIKHIPDPNRIREIDGWYFGSLMKEVNERHLKPRGLDIGSMIDDVLEKTSLLSEVLDRLQEANMDARRYIDVQPHTTHADVENAFSMIAATQPERKTGGRPRMDDLVALQCALLYDKLNEFHPRDNRDKTWTFERLAKEYRHEGVKSWRSAKSHVERGRQLLREEDRQDE